MISSYYIKNTNMLYKKKMPIFEQDDQKKFRRMYFDFQISSCKTHLFFFWSKDIMFRTLTKNTLNFFILDK